MVHLFVEGDLDRAVLRPDDVTPRLRGDHRRIDGTLIADEDQVGRDNEDEEYGRGCRYRVADPAGQ